jgi:hypothetical protein
MKNQYFGDTRDLFKYDLLEHLMDHLDPRRFAFIAMLTKDDHTAHGLKRNYRAAKAGYNNEDLIRFLEQNSSGDKKDFTRIKTYYQQKKIDALIYDRPFKHGNRPAYFIELPTDYLRSPLIFFDPDIGFRPKSSFDERHLDLFEFVYIFQQAPENSALMTIQFYPCLERPKYIKDKLSELKTATGLDFLSIGTTEVLFLFTSKSPQTHKKLARVSGLCLQLKRNSRKIR